MQATIDLARDRGVIRYPVIRHPVVRDRLARTWGGLRIMEMNNERLLTTVLQGGHPGPESSIGKLYWAKRHRDFGELMVELSGAAGMLTGGASHDTMSRMVHTLLNSRAETIYGGANEIQRNILAERALGLPK